jgi:subtilisin family serine protease
MIPPEIRDRALREGRVRVLLELRLSGGRHVPEGELAPAAVAAQRNDIVAARRQVLARLAGRTHRVLHQYDSVPLVALEVGADALGDLDASTFWVARVVEDTLHAPSLPQSVPLIGGDQAWSRGFDGTGVTVAIVDTGVEATHPFLTSKVIEEACYSSTVTGTSVSVCPNQSDTQTGPGSAVPCAVAGCWHGTHVAGIAAGNGATAGVTFSGVAKGASVMAVQVFSRFDNSTDCGGSPPCALAFTSDIIAGLERVYALHAVRNIAAANLSLGGPSYTASCDSDPTKPIIDNLRSVGIATVVAAGNDGLTNALSAPACISSAISVGATTKTDVIASFSNVASFLSLLAPGQSIQSSVTGGGFGIASGTSMATPHVTGAWAILKQAAPGASVDQVLSALQGTGVRLADTRPGGSVTKPRIQLDQALAVFAPVIKASLGLTYNGKVRDRVGQGNTALAADGAMDGTLTVTLSASGGRTVTGLRLQSTGPGTWDTDSGTQSWALGVATTLDGPLLNNPTTVTVSFAVADRGTFVLFASDFGGIEFVSGATLTLTATFSDGTTAAATTTVGAAPPSSPSAAALSLTYNGRLRDRVGQGNTALTADGALDGTLTATLSAAGGRTVTGLTLQSTGPGTWDTDGGTQSWALGVATTLDGPLLNNSTTAAVSFAVADGGTFVLFASDFGGIEFVSGATLTLAATFSDGTTATAATTVASSGALSLTYNGKLRDRVGQGNTALAADGARDGTLTATLSGSGGRTVTGLTLQSTGPGAWDTDGGTQSWALGVATTLDGPLLNNPTTAVVSFAVADGGTFVLFASDYAGIEFVSGATLTLTATFSDGTTATATTTVASSDALSLTYNGKLRDRVGQGNTALAADGALDGTLTATLSAAGGRTVTGLTLQSTGPGAWDTDGGTQSWALGVATTLDGPLLNNPTTAAVSFAVADGGTFVLFASDFGGIEFVSGATLTLTATFSDGTTAGAVTRIP